MYGHLLCLCDNVIIIIAQNVSTLHVYTHTCTQVLAQFYSYTALCIKHRFWLSHMCNRPKQVLHLISIRIYTKWSKGIEIEVERVLAAETKKCRVCKHIWQYLFRDSLPIDNMGIYIIHGLPTSHELFSCCGYRHSFHRNIISCTTWNTTILQWLFQCVDTFDKLSWV